MGPKTDFDDSLSSLSIESEDETNLLTQAIAAGVSKKPNEISNPINIPPFKQRQDVANESISSVDSEDKDDATNSILEECIQSGISKVVKKDSSKKNFATSSPKRSMLPTPRNTNAVSKKKSDDDEILKECIATGMIKNTRSTSMLVPNMAQLSITDSKNLQATSVPVQEEQTNVSHASVTGNLDKVYFVLKNFLMYLQFRRRQRSNIRKEVHQQHHEESSRERPNSRRKYRFRKRTFSPSNLDNAKWV